ncbi:membrane associated rhomboid family serine protease [Natranaerovirga hydrolytica]|uniref:Membrane associated rhomboid family serine protease n=1 Tax=Natranaerovirga hydrolytica TaxID=680378 RepID=A0A4R1MK61_9FIRM|nr:rhomboid family intramembrane serine protease [Natranaerovirga hydrolytica]TCK93116.1 membrane associated rhomboid family serine protease [Natranaerovirga hydrolytica]
MQLHIDKVNETLELEGYQKVPTDVEFVSTFGTIRNNDLYLINIINLEENVWVSLEQYQLYKEITEKQFKSYGYNHIYLLNIYFIKEIDDLYTRLLSHDPDYENYLVDFHWVVHNNKVIISDNQPSNYLNVYDILNAVLRDKEYQEKIKIHHKTNKTPVTYTLIAINIAILILMELSGGSTNSLTLVNFGALFSPLIVYEKEFYRLFTAMFLHIGISHLFYNMFALYLFGTRLEKIMGHFKFSILYVIAGIGGSALSLGVAVYLDAIKLAAGASGAIYGLQGAALYITIKTKANLDGITEGLLWVMTFGGLFFGFASTNVDNYAHIGGLITGFLLMMWITKLKKCE